MSVTQIRLGDPGANTAQSLDGGEPLQNEASRLRMPPDFYVAADANPSLVYSRTTPRLDLPYDVIVSEEVWLKDNPLMPIASYDDNTVTVKIYKDPNDPDNPITPLKLRSHIIPANAYLRTKSVELSFDFSFGGKNYFFTAVRISAMGYDVFAPAITVYTEDWDASGDGDVGIAWHLATPNEQAAIVSDSGFRDLMRNKLDAARVPNESRPDYDTGSLTEHLASTAVVTGCQTYNVRTGIYFYEQHVESANPIVNFAKEILGKTQAIGTALKISYHALGEGNLAGGKGTTGMKLPTIDGKTLQPGP